MLYATTRNHVDACTAHSVLIRKRGSDGGLFVPFRLNRFTEEEIMAMGERSFNANTAEILNLLFGSRLCDRDLDLGELRKRMTAAELIGHLAFAAGLIEKDAPISAAELAGEFTWDRLKGDSIYLQL